MASTKPHTMYLTSNSTGGLFGGTCVSSIVLTECAL